jgi:hypothetical protein
LVISDGPKNSWLFGNSRFEFGNSSTHFPPSYLSDTPTASSPLEVINQFIFIASQPFPLC